MTKFKEAIQIVDSTMNKLGIKYSFISGTALGLGREGECMPFDVDVDFCVHTENRPNIENIVNALGLQTISTMRYGSRLEGIGFDIGGNNWVEMDFLHTRGDKVWYTAIINEGIITKVYPKRMWDNLEFIHAYGVKCPVFHPIHEYLRMLYGEDWKTPNPCYFQQELFRKTEARHYDWDLTED